MGKQALKRLGCPKVELRLNLRREAFFSVIQLLQDTLQIAFGEWQNLGHLFHYQSKIDITEWREKKNSTHFVLVKSKRTGRSRHREEMETKYFANFQKEYPAHREEIRKCIRCLYEIADKIDKTNKDCAITDVAVSSAGATSGILSILGLTLAPFSAGISLILSATGIGLGIAATATDISASVAKYIIDSEDLKKVHALMKECQESIRIVMHADEFDFSPESDVVQLMYKCYKVYDGTQKLKTHVKALKTARANPELAALAQRATAASSAARAAMEGLEEVETAFRGTALAMTRGKRMLKAASAVFCLLYDAYSIFQGALHLTKGAKTAVAAEIRERASKLEEVLQDLDELYKELNNRY